MLSREWTYRPAVESDEVEAFVELTLRVHLKWRTREVAVATLQKSFRLLIVAALWLQGWILLRDCHLNSHNLEVELKSLRAATGKYSVWAARIWILMPLPSVWRRKGFLDLPHSL